MRGLPRASISAQSTKKLFHLATGPHATLYNPVDAPDYDTTVRDPERERRRLHRYADGQEGRHLAHRRVARRSARAPRVRAAHLREGRNVSRRDLDDGVSSESDCRTRRGRACTFTTTSAGHGSPTALATARVAVFPSYAEGFAWAPLEADGSRLPDDLHADRQWTGTDRRRSRRTAHRSRTAPGSIADADLSCARRRRDGPACSAMQGALASSPTFLSTKLLPANERFYRQCDRVVSRDTENDR